MAGFAVIPGMRHLDKVLVQPAHAMPCSRYLQGRNVEDGTVRIRTRQSILRHKKTLVLCAVLALIGVVGWLTTL